MQSGGGKWLIYFTLQTPSQLNGAGLFKSISLVSGWCCYASSQALGTVGFPLSI